MTTNQSIVCPGRRRSIDVVMDCVRLYPSDSHLSQLKRQILVLNENKAYLDTEIVCRDGSVCTNSLLAALGYPELYMCSSFLIGHFPNTVIMPDAYQQQVHNQLQCLLGADRNGLPPTSKGGCHSDRAKREEDSSVLSALAVSKHSIVVHHESNEPKEVVRPLGVVDQGLCQSQCIRENNSNTARSSFAGAKDVTLPPADYPSSLQGRKRSLSCDGGSYGNSSLISKANTTEVSTVDDCGWRSRPLCAWDYFVQSDASVQKQNSDKILICSLCQASLTIKKNNYVDDLVDHLNRYHSDVKLPAVANDEASSSNVRLTLEKHTTDCKDRTKSSHSTVCPQCGKTIKDLNRHIKRYHFDKSAAPVAVQCDVCKRTFKRKCNLTEHLRMVHQKLIRFRCEFCERGFYNRAQVRRHVRIMHMNVKSARNQAACPECGKTMLVSTLNKHRRVIHQGIKNDDRSFCDECGRQFTQRGSLLAHLRRAHGREPDVTKNKANHSKSKFFVDPVLINEAYPELKTLDCQT